MEPLLEFLAVWWWTAPTTVGLGAIGYAGLTTGRRRARRLALDAARYEEGAAARALTSARAQTRAAQAQVLSAQARNGAPSPGVPSVAEARRQLQLAKQAQKSASLELKASRNRVRAERTHLSATSKADGTPLERLVREHDAILARWLEYETDVETTIAFPQMSDPHDPTTAAFLDSQRNAQWLRPTSPTARMTPERFAAYRSSVHALGAAFEHAEDAAMRASGRRGAERSRSNAAPPPSTVEDLAARATERVTTWVTESVTTWAAARTNPAKGDGAAGTPPTGAASPPRTSASGGPTPGPGAAADSAEAKAEPGPAPKPKPKPYPEPVRPPLWPVPRRESRPPEAR
ncbi:hypothetical protein [Microbacterium sp. 18062]|uniref:hypothetical protein n=1 Tax=Microbacterium sp. 18062 TaxID=2681410 RepID=UPI00135AA202|nr:hypothetical protein [Microbacterium sp. 18062]